MPTINANTYQALQQRGAAAVFSELARSGGPAPGGDSLPHIFAALLDDQWIKDHPAESAQWLPELYRIFHDMDAANPVAEAICQQAQRYLATPGHSHLPYSNAVRDVSLVVANDAPQCFNDLELSARSPIFYRELHDRRFVTAQHRAGAVSTIKPHLADAPGFQVLMDALFGERKLSLDEWRRAYRALQSEGLPYQLHYDPEALAQRLLACIDETSGPLPLDDSALVDLFTDVLAAHRRGNGPAEQRLFTVLMQAMVDRALEADEAAGGHFHFDSPGGQRAPAKKNMLAGLAGKLKSIVKEQPSHSAPAWQRCLFWQSSFESLLQDFLTKSPPLQALTFSRPHRCNAATVLWLMSKMPIGVQQLTFERCPLPSLEFIDLLFALEKLTMRHNDAIEKTDIPQEWLNHCKLAEVHFEDCPNLRDVSQLAAINIDPATGKPNPAQVHHRRCPKLGS